ncbi:hypothetical protein BDM02DRAFT_3111733 [Thelephora ganbajun]|uniref:Uncharacterized protein n=1 Tax=Thelephora ganbajun TaxID=370292 RepID=A0ACB6ZM77_THEGA|nr:hypothetical protein BDM02DRAFT_3111733 [Thelephora ganbajun]
MSRLGTHRFLSATGVIGVSTNTSGFLFAIYSNQRSTGAGNTDGRGGRTDGVTGVSTWKNAAVSRWLQHNIHFGRHLHTKPTGEISIAWPQPGPLLRISRMYKMRSRMNVIRIAGNRHS